MSDFSALQNLNIGSNASLLASKEQIVAINLDDINALEQVRSESNEGFIIENNDDDNASNTLSSLARSIRDGGLKQPIIVRPAHEDPNDLKSPIINNKYTIVCGERRYRASKLVRQWQQEEQEEGKLNPDEKILNTIDCIIRNYDSLERIVVDQLTENVQRTELNTFEIASSLKKIEDLYIQEHPDDPNVKNGKLKRSKLADITGKSCMWLSQIMAFNNVPLELITYFNEGVISKSPRTGYDIINAFKKDPEITIDFLDRKRQAGILVDRSFIAELQALIARKENLQDAEQMPNLDIPKLDDPQEQGNVQDSQFQAQDYSENTDGYEGESSTTENGEYTELNERDKSAEPKMFAKNQENTAPTAGINATSTYTDRDTRVAHDLSDSIHDEGVEPSYEPDYEEEVTSVEENDADKVEIEGIYCSYKGQDYLLILDDAPSNTQGILQDLNGNKINVNLTEVSIKSFKFK